MPLTSSSGRAASCRKTAFAGCAAASYRGFVDTGNFRTNRICQCAQVPGLRPPRTVLTISFLATLRESGPAEFLAVHFNDLGAPHHQPDPWSG